MATESAVPSTRVRGIELALTELRVRGLKARSGQGRQLNDITATRSDRTTVLVRVKTRSRGDWQVSTGDGEARPERDPTRFVLFVDLIPATPRFFVMPEWEYKIEVYRDHADYLRHNPGRRGPNGSKHHKVVTDSVADWRDRWDLITGTDDPMGPR